MIDQEKIKQAVKLLLEGIGEDAEREGLKETPERIARMYEEIYGGIEEDAAEHLKKTFHVDNNEIVMEKDITFYSTCEHHLLPLLWKGPYCIYSRRKGSRLKQTRQNCRSICQKASDSGAADGADCRCPDGASEAKRSTCDDRGRTYVHDNAGNQKTREPDRDSS